MSDTLQVKAKSYHNNCSNHTQHKPAHTNTHQRTAHHNKPSTALGERVSEQAAFARALKGHKAEMGTGCATCDRERVCWLWVAFLFASAEPVIQTDHINTAVI